MPALRNCVPAFVVFILIVAASIGIGVHQVLGFAVSSAVQRDDAGEQPAHAVGSAANARQRHQGVPASTVAPGGALSSTTLPSGSFR